MAVLKKVTEFREFIMPFSWNVNTAKEGEEDNRATIELKCAGPVAIQDKTIEQQSMSPEKVAVNNRDFTASHVGKIRNLTLDDGTNIETFKDILDNNLLHIYAWIQTVTMNDAMLSAEQEKN